MLKATKSRVSRVGRISSYLVQPRFWFINVLINVHITIPRMIPVLNTLQKPESMEALSSIRVI